MTEEFSILQDYYHIIEKPNYVSDIKFDKLNKDIYDKFNKHYTKSFEEKTKEILSKDLYNKLSIQKIKIIGIQIGADKFKLVVPLYPLVDWNKFKEIIINEITDNLDIELKINDICFSNNLEYIEGDDKSLQLLEISDIPYNIIEDGSNLYVPVIKIDGEDEWQTFYVEFIDSKETIDNLKICNKCLCDISDNNYINEENKYYCSEKCKKS